MKIGKISVLLGMVLIIASTFAGCGSKSSGDKLEGPLNGKWSYIHDTETVALEIKDDGTAKLDDVSYDCTYDESAVVLTDKKGTKTNHRYYTEGEDKLYFYKISTYRYQGEGKPDGLVGVWVDVANGNSSFEFTSEGTFREDSYIPGYYIPNVEKNSIQLVYNDHYEDTIIYYTLKDDCMIVEYPWLMVRYGK